jgi:hypothetical protein
VPLVVRGGSGVAVQAVDVSLGAVTVVGDGVAVMAVRAAMASIVRIAAIFGCLV